MTPVLLWASAALILASLVVSAAGAIVIARLDRGDERAAIDQACAELDKRISEIGEQLSGITNGSSSADEPIPLWPADPGPEDLEALVTATTCGRCQPLGYGLCWCEPAFGHPFCCGEPMLR